MNTTMPEKGTAEREKLIALKKHLELGRDITDVKIDENRFEVGREEYLVLTDSEADEEAKNSILESVWAFNKSFLDGHSEAISEIDEEVFSKIQEMCESANKTILRLIDDVDAFIEDAISSDGRGHFMSSYDGEENEVQVNGTYYFIYRIN